MNTHMENEKMRPEILSSLIKSYVAELNKPSKKGGLASIPDAWEKMIT